MQHLTFNLHKQEWLRIAAVAHQTWPDDKLSKCGNPAPVCNLRAAVLIGVQDRRTLENVLPVYDS